MIFITTMTTMFASGLSLACAAKAVTTAIEATKQLIKSGATK